MFGPFGGDPVQFTFTARVNDEGSARGRFDIVHRSASGGLVARMVGEVTCLIVSGDLASITGVVTQARTPGLPGLDVVGDGVAITVRDHGTSDSLGFAFEFFAGPVPPCASVEPFLPVGRGDFTVHGATTP
ncbi:hypothetical protein BH18ACT4_BH18ACT4_02080 [soil metagenome]